MKYFLALIISCHTIFAATLLSLTASEDGDKIDVVLSFDTQFEGNIEQTMSPKGPVLYISDAVIDAKKEITFKSQTIKKIILSKESPSRAALQIESDSPLNIEAQKSNDNHKLEFIVSSSSKPTQTPYDKTRSEQFSKSFSEKFDQSREQKSESDFYWRYIVVIAFMAFLLIVLVIVKKYYAGKQEALKNKAKAQNREFVERGDERRQGAPLPEDKYDIVERGNDRRQGIDPYSDFASAHNHAKQDRQQSSSFARADEELNIISQKSIDDKNKLVAVEYDGDRYLLLIGPNSTIMEKTATDRRAKEFEETFLRNDNRLENYLKSKPLSKLDLYKARAEGD